MKNTMFNMLQVWRVLVFLSVFAWTDNAQADDYFSYWAMSTHPCSITGHGGTKFEFSILNQASGGYYYRGNADYGYTDLSVVSGVAGYDCITADIPLGLRFKGWYTKKDGWSDTALVAEIDKDPIETNQTIYFDKIAKAGLFYDRPTIVAKYVRIFDITAVADPTAGGTVTGGGTYEEGENATLTATANDGWEFVKWREDDVTDKSRTLSNISSSATYTAEFKEKTFSLTLELKEGVARIGYKTSPDADYTYVTEDTVITAAYRSTYYVVAEAKPGWIFTNSSTTTETFSNITSNQTFYRAPARAEYELTVNPNGGLYDSKDYRQTQTEKLAYGGTNLNQIKVAAKTDKSPLLGYWDSSSGGKQVYDETGRYVAGDYWTEDGKFRGTKNLEVYAMWGTPKKIYTITAVPFFADTGTVSGSGAYEEDSEVKLTATAEAGYSFCCWSNATGVVATDNPWTFTANATAEYTAVFTGNVYVVTFFGNGGKPEEQVRAYTHGSAYGEFPAINRDGYHFDGWFTAAGSKGVLVSEEDLFLNVDNDGELYAHWTEITEFDVTFADPKGGNASVLKTCTKGQQIGEAPAGTANWKRKGYWRDNSLDWDQPLTTSVTSNMTVNAKWTSIADVLDCTNLVFDVVPGARWAVCNDDPVVGETCMRLEYSSGNDHLQTTISEAGTLSFNWKATAAGLSISAGNEDIWQSAGKTAKWTTGSREAIEIEGPCELKFYSQTKGPVDCLIDNVVWTPGLAPKKHTVEVDADERGSAMKSPLQDEYEVNESVTLTATPNPGYAFCCWTNDTGFATNANPWTFKVTNDVTCTASFTACVYRVTLRANGEAWSEVAATYGEALPALVSVPQREHYGLLGFFDAETGGKQYYDASGNGVASWDKLEDVELLARWEEDGKASLSVVSADEARGTVAKDPDKDSYYVGTEVTISATPKPGYAFAAWNDGATEASHKVVVGQTAATYTASFTACVYRVTLNANEGVGGTTEVWATYGEPMPTLGSKPTRTGFSFIGYFDAATGGAKYYNADGTSAAKWNKTSVAELFAQWQKNVSDVSLALDCSNLDFSKTAGWVIKSDEWYYTEGEGNDGRYLDTTSANEALTATVTESGTLTFYWCAYGEGLNPTVLAINVNGEAAFGSGNIYGEHEAWTHWSAHIDVEPGQSAKISISCPQMGGYCDIDYVKWIPDAAPTHPEPTEADAVTISSAVVSGGKLTLSFGGKADFDYELWANDDISDAEGWTLQETKSGQDNITFEPEAVPGQPKMFYKVKTTQKKDR